MAATALAVMATTWIGTGPAQAGQSSGTPEEQAKRAMSSATQGDSDELDRLLKSDHASAMRQEIQRWAEARPIPKPNILRGRTTQNQKVNLFGTGTYEYFCTGYNGQTIGWNGKVYHACHGYWDSYISGNHAQHSMPDVYPTGEKVSVACKKAGVGATITAFGALASGVPTGTAGWVAGAASVTWAAQDVYFSCGRRY